MRENEKLSFQAKENESEGISSLKSFISKSNLLLLFQVERNGAEVIQSRNQYLRCCQPNLIKLKIAKLDFVAKIGWLGRAPGSKSNQIALLIFQS